MLRRKLCLLFLVTAASCFYVDYEVKPADVAIHELLEEKYNPNYKPEDLSDDVLMELAEESLSTFVELLSEKSHVMKFLNKELKHAKREFLIFINKLFLSVNGKGDDDPLDLVKCFVRDHMGEVKELFPNIRDFMQLCYDLIFPEGERRKRDLQDQLPLAKESFQTNGLPESVQPSTVIMKNFHKDKFVNPFAEFMESKKQAAKSLDGMYSKENYIKGIVGGFTRTIGDLLDEVARNTNHKESFKVHRIQKKFKDMNEDIEEKLMGFRNKLY